MHNTTTAQTIPTENSTEILFIDKFTDKSMLDKAQLYAQYQKDGNDLYELRVTAEMTEQVPSMDFDVVEKRTYTITFNTINACIAYAENLHNAPAMTVLPFKTGYETDVICEAMKIVQIYPTNRDEALLLSSCPLPTSKVLVWENHEDPIVLESMERAAHFSNEDSSDKTNSVNDVEMIKQCTAGNRRQMSEDRLQDVKKSIGKRLLCIKKREKCFAEVVHKPGKLNAVEYVGALGQCSNERVFLEMLQSKIEIDSNPMNSAVVSSDDSSVSKEEV